MLKKLKKIDFLEVRICKREESSGNEQFFVRLVRTDEKTHNSILEYICFQTKHLDKKECIKNAWFSAGLLARFAGLSSMDEVILMDFDQEEQDIAKSSSYLRW